MENANYMTMKEQFLTFVGNEEEWNKIEEQSEKEQEQFLISEMRDHLVNRIARNEERREFFRNMDDDTVLESINALGTMAGVLNENN